MGRASRLVPVKLSLKVFLNDITLPTTLSISTIWPTHFVAKASGVAKVLSCLISTYPFGANPATLATVMAPEPLFAPAVMPVKTPEFVVEILIQFWLIIPPKSKVSVV